MTKAQRRTKIIATLGPAADDLSRLEDLIRAGVNIFRCNFSHGSADEHRARVARVRQAAENCDCEIGILADLQGPKIRIARFKNQSVELQNGAKFCLDADLDAGSGDDSQVGLDYASLPQEVAAGDVLLLNDGMIVLKVVTVQGQKIQCEVQVGGTLSNNKGINRKGGGLNAGAITDKDRIDIVIAAELEASFVAISFVSSPDDVIETRQLLEQHDCFAAIVSKIERPEAVGLIDDIIKVSDAVMVARGDLGVEIGFAQVPAVQKMIIHHARSLDKAVITATQMMESMIDNPVPTRAEVSDIANAVLDGTDAVMLSAETATGAYPVEAVTAMSEVCLTSETNPRTQTSQHRLQSLFTRVDEAIAMATMYTANHLDIKAIIALTESGSTPLWMSRIRSGIPIYGLCPHKNTRGKMTLYRGVYPIAFNPTDINRIELKNRAIEELVSRGLVEPGDRVIITAGERLGITGRTNSMKIVEVSAVT